MKKCSQWVLVTIVLLIFLNLLPYIGHAQPIGNIDPEGDVDAPFDSGIILLIAIGIGYGFIKANLAKRKKIPANSTI